MFYLTQYLLVDCYYLGASLIDMDAFIKLEACNLQNSYLFIGS
jgi:hypothetical protein